MNLASSFSKKVAVSFALYLDIFGPVVNSCNKASLLNTINTRFPAIPLFLMYPYFRNIY
nr:MAG TPA: hypothetical protein [Bacteriophage sp.]